MPHIKNGADYFPFYVSFFTDSIAIKKLKSIYHANGIETYIRLLCAIYSAGYYIEYNEDLVDTLSMDVDVKENFIREVINFLVTRSMFDNTLFNRDKILTSPEIQSRYQDLMRARASKRMLRGSALEVDGRYWLLSENETDSCIKVRPFSGLSETKQSLSKTKPRSSVTKAHKEKNSKVKKSKVKKKTALRVILPLRGRVFRYRVEKRVEKKVDAVIREYQRFLPAWPAATPTAKLMANIGMGNNPMDVYVRLFDMAARSSFLMKPKANWRCDIEWLTDPVNMAKVLSGKYNNFSQPEKSSIQIDEAKIINGVESGFDTGKFFEAALNRGRNGK